ncbi:hypothetical protein [uncultured Methanobacterium sp.]|uniref:hypothetical protein n=1 Tax=uncultured Methanobacterium sp. TaxID=176306 RepID=UPI002AA635AE|nr:hypothetical protein [uncultured Methanobacterium sp.]
MIALDDTSRERGWSHQDMLKMPKRVFWRYYGSIFREKLRILREKEKKDREKEDDEFKAIEQKWRKRRERGEI